MRVFSWNGWYVGAGIVVESQVPATHASSWQTRIVWSRGVLDRLYRHRRRVGSWQGTIRSGIGGSARDGRQVQSSTDCERSGQARQAAIGRRGKSSRLKNRHGRKTIDSHFTTCESGIHGVDFTNPDSSSKGSRQWRRKLRQRRMVPQ